MMKSEMLVKKEECQAAACLLSIAGGWVDVYSYLFRGHVFANAVTGNMVQFAVHLSDGEWADCIKYLFSIAAYGGGVLLANYIRDQNFGSRHMVWQQFILLLEAALLIPAAFIPVGPWDVWINGLISFVCAMQVQTFRYVHGQPFASTMCTGNLRSGMDALFQGIFHKRSEELAKAMHYGLIIAFFILGAVAGAFLTGQISGRLILCPPAILLLVILLIRGPSQEQPPHRENGL